MMSVDEAGWGKASGKLGPWAADKVERSLIAKWVPDQSEVDQSRAVLYVAQLRSCRARLKLLEEELREIKGHSGVPYPGR